MQETPRPKAYSYLRFSTPEQQKGDSFRRQSSMATSYAARNGLDLDTSLTFHDLGVSAFKGLNAETGRLADFLEAVQTGLVPQGSFLLVEALDRLSRLVPRKALRVLTDIVDAGVAVVTLNDEKVYTEEGLDRDPIDLLVAVMLFMRANEESATKSRRITASWEGKRLNALTKPITAVVPGWIRLDKTTAPGQLVLIPERAEVVKRIFAESLAGRGSTHITKGLINAGVPCFGKSAHWHRTYVRKILDSPATYGTFLPHQTSHSGTKVVRVPLEPIAGYYPAAISQDTFEASQNLKGTAYPVKARVGQLANLFGGLALCPLCGASMTRVNKGSVSKGGKPKLVCSKAKVGAGCTYHGVNLKSAEDGLLSNIDEFIGDAPSGIVGLDIELDKVEISIGVVQDHASNITEALAIGPSVSLAKKLRELEITLSELEASKVELVDKISSGSSPVLGQRLNDLEAALIAETLDRTKANAHLRSVLASVVIDFPSGKLNFNWKHGGTSSITYAWPLEIRPSADVPSVI